jgi:hypothetical protein
MCLSPCQCPCPSRWVCLCPWRRNLQRVCCTASLCSELSSCHVRSTPSVKGKSYDVMYSIDDVHLTFKRQTTPILWSTFPSLYRTLLQLMGGIGGHRHRPQCRRYPTSDIDICYSDIGRKYVGLKTVIPISEGFRYRHPSPFRYPISKKYLSHQQDSNPRHLFTQPLC